MKPTLWIPDPGKLTREDYCSKRTKEIVDTLLAARRKRGEDVAALEVKLTAYLGGMLQVVYDEVKLVGFTMLQVASEEKLQAAYKRGVHEAMSQPGN